MENDFGALAARRLLRDTPRYQLSRGLLRTLNVINVVRVTQIIVTLRECDIINHGLICRITIENIIQSTRACRQRRQEKRLKIMFSQKMVKRRFTTADTSYAGVNLARYVKLKVAMIFIARTDDCTFAFYCRDLLGKSLKLVTL